MNRTDLQAPSLAGPPQTNLEAGTPSCITPLQPTIYDEVFSFLLFFLMKRLVDSIINIPWNNFLIKKNNNNKID